MTQSMDWDDDEPTQPWRVDPFCDTCPMAVLEAVPETIEDGRQEEHRLSTVYMVVKRRRWR